MPARSPLLHHRAYGLDSPRTDEGPNWRRLAVCAQADPEMWSIAGRKLSAANRAAIELCGTCPVRVECDQWARQSPPVGTIAAGLPYYESHMTPPAVDGPSTRTRRCPNCGRWFASRVLYEPGRPLYCGNACKSAAHRAKAAAK